MASRDIKLEKRMKGNDKNALDVPHEYAPPKNLFDSSQPKNEVGESAKKFLLEQIKSVFELKIFESIFSEKDGLIMKNIIDLLAIRKVVSQGKILKFQRIPFSDIIVLRNRGRPEAIVHFPNWQ